jgi:hypothetical protein
MMNKRIGKTNRWVILAVLVLLLLSTLPLLLQAQGGLNLRWSNVSSGYGISSGQGFIVAGTSGEVDGGPPLSGDGFTMTGGFWSGVDEPPPLATPSPAGQYQIYLPSAVGD